MAVAVTDRHGPGTQGEGRQLLVLAGSASAIVLTAAAAALGASADSDEPGLTAVLRGAMVAAPLVAGLYGWSARPSSRFARLLIATGLLTFATTLSESSDPVLYSVVRIAGLGLEAMLVVLLLAFPTGRLTEPVDRRLTQAIVAAVAVFYLPQVALASQYRLPNPYTSCTSGCPDNAFRVVASEPTTVVRVLVGLGSVSVFLIMVAVVVRLQQRIAAAGPPQRRLLVPVLAVGIARTVLVGCAIVGRDLGGTGPLVTATAHLIAWVTPLFALAFLADLVRARLFTERALRGLAADVRGAPDAATLQHAFADAFDDRSVAIVVPATANATGPAWMDARGAPAATPRAGDGRCVHVVCDRSGALVAALVCDAGLAEWPELLEAGAALAAVALDNQRLAADAEAAAREVRRSRARLAASADRERRRIERDLHDGAQQHLVALRIELGLLGELVERDPHGATARLRELEGSVDEALDELRSLAHGVCPPLLADRGLVEALRGAVSRCPVPVELDAQEVGRYPSEVESAVYFGVLEALQNVAKHAAGATRVDLRLRADADGTLRFGVRDDGCGAAEAALTHGVGVTNMKDRLAAVGGELVVASRRGRGTVVEGRVPAGGP